MRAHPPRDVLEAGWQSRPWPMVAHWYGPPNPMGLEVFTSETVSWIAPDRIGLRFTGTLTPPLAEELRKLLLATPQRFNHVVLERDSDGGELS
jgi:hypothetical protein